MVFVHQDDLKALLKSLPRLPSTDEAFDDFDNLDSDSTPKAAVSGLPSLHQPETGYFGQQPNIHSSTTSLPTVQANSPTDLEARIAASSRDLPPTPQNIDNLQLLANLRHSFQREEQLLYGQLSRTPVGTLNNVRRAFITSAEGAMKRLSAWENKHVPKGAAVVPSLSAKRPLWWDNSSHAVPGGNVVVREGDWGSIIAFTLRLGPLLFLSRILRSLTFCISAPRITSENFQV
jgi:1-phosphatidylinositol-3-phosphate 5-kinase